MKRMAMVMGIGLMTAGIVGCGPAAGPDRQETASPRSSAQPTPAGECQDFSHGSSGESPVLSKTGGQVSAQANIFGAGRETPPAPGGGGGGALPPVLVLPDGATRTVTFPKVVGRVNPIIGSADWNGPAGDEAGPTDVKSFEGISGIFDRTNGMFLVGVFLTDAPPANPAPPRLNFSTFELEEPGTLLVPNGEDFDVLAPEIGQTFFIGDGKGHSYSIPVEATRLFLGFADGYGYEGCPGWYGNNSGRLTVTIRVRVT